MSDDEYIYIDMGTWILPSFKDCVKRLIASFTPKEKENE